MSSSPVTLPSSPATLWVLSSSPASSAATVPSSPATPTSPATDSADSGNPFLHPVSDYVRQAPSPTSHSGFPSSIEWNAPPPHLDSGIPLVPPRLLMIGLNRAAPKNGGTRPEGTVVLFVGVAHAAAQRYHGACACRTCGVGIPSQGQAFSKTPFLFAIISERVGFQTFSSRLIQCAHDGFSVRPSCSGEVAGYPAGLGQKSKG